MGGSTSNVDPSEYRLRFFHENGFQRKKCKVGGEYFWTLNPDFDTCQDAPCVEYWFDEIKVKAPLSVEESRSKFIDFFRRNGHTPVDPRPVVARWRDDLYLTIASIVVFQPHVTSGLVPPPANPLVISQPSIRLEDIDNVGLTVGRHLTTFEMAAHHAFNYPDSPVYWKEETVEYAFRFFTEEIGIPPELIVFKESWWEGGGNAGPSFEVAVGGLELATLVFMKYRVTEDGYQEIPLKIVDTGYGIERIAWFTQKTPTAFHAIYQGIYDEFRRKLDIEEPPRELLWTAFRAAGRLDPEDPGSVKAYYERLARESGLPREETRIVMERETSLYALLDHTKTIAMMLGDGIVPSNTGEGYLARLVIRRAMRHLLRLGSDISLAELVQLQINRWARSFPQLTRNSGYIIDAVQVEEEKYKETLARGEKIVLKTLKKKKSLTLDDLIVLYDSHGLPPEIVAEAASKEGFKVEIPHNFYSIVASKHQQPARIARRDHDVAKLPGHIVDWANKFPATKRIFHENPYTKNFRGRVLGAREGYLVLDATAFYPLGGGQYYDTGIIRVNGEDVRVKEVYKTDLGVVVHVLEENKDIKSGTIVEGEIDWERRYKMMRHHTATHVILGAARRVLGEHVWQAGAEKTVEKGRLDITHHRSLSKEKIEEIEQLANKVVDQRRKVSFKVLERNDAESLYGFKIYQGGVPKTKEIRIVEIEDWDAQACFGTHLTNTGEIGAIKIISAGKLADGVIRLEYVAGTRVYEEAKRLAGILESAAEKASSQPDELPKRVENLVSDNLRLRRTLAEYRKIYVESLFKIARKIGQLRLIVFQALEEETKDIQDILRRLTSTPYTVAVALSKAGDKAMLFVALDKQASTIVTASEIVKSLSSKLGGKGGGSKTFATLRVPVTVGVDEIWELMEKGLSGNAG
ncbi:MAG: alanine--tRNA ligase [Desulfurococcales archaeon]|nr:alanine--tRNA ligase [Desulfurococcales archaeon]